MLKGYERKMLRKMIMHELESVTWYIKYRETNFFLPPSMLEVLRKRKRTLLEMYKKLNRGRRVFPTQQALEKSMYLSTKIITEKWTSRYSNWGVTISELHTFFPDRVAIN